MTRQKKNPSKKKSGKKKGGTAVPAVIGLSAAFLVILIVLVVFFADREAKQRLKEDIKPEEKTGEEAAEKPAVNPEETVARAVDEGKRIYLIIDDVGYNLHQLEEFTDFPGTLTFAVLPGLPYTRACAEYARNMKAEVILHQPMEALNGENPGPGAIVTDMPEDEIQQVLLKNLDEVPEASGINNHMGSKATSDKRVMTEVMKVMKEKKLFFIDSMTTPESVAERAADEFGVSFAKRRVFLDNECGGEAVRTAFEEGLEAAEKDGYVIMIGHVWCDSVALYLINNFEELTRKGFVFLGISELVR